MNRSRLFSVISWGYLKPWFWWILKVGISGGILFIIFRQVSLKELFLILTNVQPIYFMLAIFLFFPAQALMAYRWYLLLNHIEFKLPYWTVFRVNLIGQLSTIVLPGQLMGDVVRIITLSQSQGNLSKTALSALMDKLLLLVAVSFFAIMGTFAPATLGKLNSVFLIIYGMFFMSITSVIILGRIRSKNLDSRIESIAHRTPIYWLKKLMNLRSLTIPKISWHVMGLLLFLAFGLQAMNILGSFLLAQAFQITSLSLISWAAIHSIVSLVQVLPVSIGGLGLREGAFVILLAPYGVSTAEAFGFSLSGFMVINILLVMVWLIVSASNFKKLFDSRNSANQLPKI